MNKSDYISNYIIFLIKTSNHYKIHFDSLLYFIYTKNLTESIVSYQNLMFRRKTKNATPSLIYFTKKLKPTLKTRYQFLM